MLAGARGHREGKGQGYGGGAGKHDGEARRGGSESDVCAQAYASTRISRCIDAGGIDYSNCSCKIYYLNTALVFFFELKSALTGPPQGGVFEDPDAGAGGTSGYMDVGAGRGAHRTPHGASERGMGDRRTPQGSCGGCPARQPANRRGHAHRRRQRRRRRATAHTSDSAADADAEPPAAAPKACAWAGCSKRLPGAAQAVRPV